LQDLKADKELCHLESQPPQACTYCSCACGKRLVD